MRNQLKKEINKLKAKKQLDEQTYLKFINFINSNNNLIKANNPDRHLCAFFLPVDFSGKLMYLGHHIKANDWIPPGGHLNKNELPIQTVYREFYEELKYELTNEKVELFDLTIKDVSGNPRHGCKTHYDFWYLVFMEKHDFDFDKTEFYTAGWISGSVALKKAKLKQYNEIIKKVVKIFEL